MIREEKARRLDLAERQRIADEAERIRARCTSLLGFTKEAWHLLEPGRELVGGWPIEAICEHLEAVSNGEINRLLINVPPGFMKPVHVDEMIATKRGLLPLKDVVVGDQVLTHKGRYRSVTAVHQQGVIPTVVVSTFAGRKVRAAPDHPFLTPKGWVNAGDLVPGDYVGFPRRHESWGDSQMPDHEARLLGYLVGDGCISERSLSFVSADADIIADFIACASACGFYAYVTTHPNSNVKAKKVVLRSAAERIKKSSGELPVLIWLKSHGLYRSNSYTKRIPAGVFSSGEAAVRNFIGAYWSCDGMFAIRHVGRKTTMLGSASTVSEGLADDVLKALTLLNINARKRRHEVALKSKKQGDTYVSFNVITSERNEVAKFYGMPGLCERKNLLAAKAFNDRFEPEIYGDEVISVDPAEDGECRCLTVEEDSSFTANGLAVHNSMLCNVFFPAWQWGPQNMAHLRHIGFSYSSALTYRDNGRFRDLVRSAWYQELYGDRFTLRKVGEERVTNNRMGFKFASSVGGVSTGERSDVLVLDDAHNVKEAESDAVRQETVRWVREGMSNRLNDMEKSSIIGIMQRVHEDDASNALIETGEYEHLMIPMEWDGRRYHTSIGWTDPREEDGELAWGDRFSRRVVESFKTVLGPYGFAGQYQQAPTPRGGGIFKRDWWQLWGNLDNPDDPEFRKFPQCEYILASLDTAYTEKTENDYSALTIWGLFYDRYEMPKAILMNAWRDRLAIHALVERVAATCRRFKVDNLLIESKAAGISVSQELKRLHASEGYGVQLVDPGRGDKTARAYAVQHLFADEMIYAPDREWADMVITEMASFPRSPKDDLVDTCTMALKHLRDQGFLIHGAEMAAEMADQLAYQPSSRPLYPV